MSATTIEKEPNGYNRALKAVVSSKQASTSFIQRQLSIGYNKAAEIVERLEANGVVTAPNQKGQRLVNLDVLQIPQHEREEQEMANEPKDEITITGPDGETLYSASSEQFQSDAERIATDAAMGHNSREAAPLLADQDALNETAREKLRLTIERIERLEEEKKEIADQIKDIYGEAKALGYDTKALRSVVRIRKQDRQERQEQEAILEVYLDALGEL